MRGHWFLGFIVLTEKMTLLKDDFENIFKDSYDPFFFIAIGGYIVQQGSDFSGLHPNEDETWISLCRFFA